VIFFALKLASLFGLGSGPNITDEENVIVLGSRSFLLYLNSVFLSSNFFLCPSSFIEFRVLSLLSTEAYIDKNKTKN